MAGADTLGFTVEVNKKKAQAEIKALTLEIKKLEKVVLKVGKALQGDFAKPPKALVALVKVLEKEVSALKSLDANTRKLSSSFSKHSTKVKELIEHINLLGEAYQKLLKVQKSYVNSLGRESTALLKVGESAKSVTVLLNKLRSTRADVASSLSRSADIQRESTKNLTQAISAESRAITRNTKAFTHNKVIRGLAVDREQEAQVITAFTQHIQASTSAVKGENRALKKNSESLDRAKKSKLAYIAQSAFTFSLFGGYLKLTEFISNTVSEFLTLEANLFKVQNLFDGTTQKMYEFEQGIKSISNATGALSSEVTNSLYQAISSGINPDDAVGVTDIATRLAVAGATTSETAMKGLISVINAYGLSVEEAEGLADKFFNTQKRGVVTIEELSNVIGELAPITSKLNISIDEMLALLVETTKVIPNASKVTNGWRQAIVNLIRPTVEAQKVADELGVAIGSAQVQYRGLIPVLEDLRVATKGNVEQLSRVFSDVDGLKVVIAQKNYEDITATAKKMGEEFGQVEVSRRRLERGLSFRFNRNLANIRNFFTVPRKEQATSFSLLIEDLDNYQTKIQSLADSNKISKESFIELREEIEKYREQYRSLRDEDIFSKSVLYSEKQKDDFINISDEVALANIREFYSNLEKAEISQRKLHDLLEGTLDISDVIKTTDLALEIGDISKVEFTEKAKEALQKRLEEASKALGIPISPDVVKQYDIDISNAFEALDAPHEKIRKEEAEAKALADKEALEAKAKRLLAKAELERAKGDALRIRHIKGGEATDREDEARAREKQDALDKKEAEEAREKERLERERQRRIDELNRQTVVINEGIPSDIQSIISREFRDREDLSFDNLAESVDKFLDERKGIKAEIQGLVREISEKLKFDLDIESVSLFDLDQEKLLSILSIYRRHLSQQAQLGRDSYEEQLEDTKAFLDKYEEQLGESYVKFEEIVKKSLDRQKEDHIEQATFLDGLGQNLLGSLGNYLSDSIGDALFGSGGSTSTGNRALDSQNSNSGPSFLETAFRSLTNFSLGFIGLEKGGVVEATNGGVGLESGGVIHPSSSGTRLGNLPVVAGEKGQAEQVTVRPMTQYQSNGMPTTIILQLDGRTVSKVALNNNTNTRRKGQG